MKLLLIDVDDIRANKLAPIIAWTGIDMITINNSNADIYQLVGEMHPEIILVDTNSPNRDTLEHLAQLQKTRAPKASTASPPRLALAFMPSMRFPPRYCRH